MAIDLKPSIQLYQNAVNKLLEAKNAALKSLNYTLTDTYDPHKARKAVLEMYKQLAKEMGITGDETTIFNALKHKIGVDVLTLAAYAAQYGLTEEILKAAADREIIDAAVNNFAFPFGVYDSVDEAEKKKAAAIEEMKKFGFTYNPSDLETPMDLEARLKEVLNNAAAFIARRPGKFELK